MNETTQNSKRNIVLIGMTGCGKSTTGIILAKAMEMDFIDADLIMQKKHGKPLSEILEESGNYDFKKKEAEVLLELNCENTVIATGGSAVYSEMAMKHIKKNGIIVFINVCFTNIQKRIGNTKNRGVVIDKGKTLRDLYYERLTLYERYADIKVTAHDSDTEQIVTDIMEALKNYE